MTELKHQRIHPQNEFERLLYKKDEASLYLQTNKDEATDLARKVPIEMLALEWLNSIDASIETRAYLVENFLPVLVLGCEKVLKEAGSKNLIQENKSDLNYNPINFLAQFLMRNNPKYNNHNETSSYVRTIRQVYQELREQMFAFQENKLAKIKADVRHRREEREKQEKLKQIEKDRRKAVVAGLFHNWLVSTHGRLEMAIVQSTFEIYHNQIEALPNDIRPFSRLNLRSIPAFCFIQDKLNYDKRLLKGEFVQCLLNVSENMSSEIFDFFTQFVHQCAKHFIYLANKNTSYRIFYKLFELLDVTKSGYLRRKRVLDVLVAYLKQHESKFRHPLRWPVLDPYIRFENQSLLSQNVQEEAEEEEMKGEAPLLDRVEIEEPAALENPNAVNATVESAKPADVIETQITKPVGEANSEADRLSNLESESQAKVSVAGEQQALDVPAEQNEETGDKESDRKEKRKDSKKSNEDITMKVSIDKEILFIKGGIMYFTPLKESINAFDRGLITNEYQKLEASRFNTEYVDGNQFVMLLNNYCISSFFNSEADTNQFINFIKDYYTESHMERGKKIEYLNDFNQKMVHEEKFSNVFEKLDNEGSGYINFDLATSLFEKFKDGMYKDAIQSISYGTRQDLLKIVNVESLDKLEMTREEFIKYLGTFIEHVRSPMVTEQLCQYLSNALPLDYAERVRGEHRRGWLNQIKYVGETSTGSFEPLYKQLFSSLLKDGENHGDGKNISAYVAILEKTNNDTVLRYHASTPNDSKFVLNKVITRKSKNISFAVVDHGHLVHVPRVSANELIHYFDPQCDRDGSLVILPLKYRRNRIYGVVGIDTLRESSNKSYFQDHEIKFYQGVATTFARSYANIIFKNRLIKCCLSAIKWLSHRCKSIQECKLYFVEAFDKEHAEATHETAQQNPSSVLLKQILKYSAKEQKLHDNTSISGNQGAKPHDSSHLKDKNHSNSYIGPHVYECAISSESTVGYFDTDVSYCYSLRNEDHKALFVFEILTKGTNHEINTDVDQLETVLYVLHKCQEELLEENLLGKTNADFEFEDRFEQEKSEVLFEKKYFSHIVHDLREQENSLVVDSTNGLATHENVKKIINSVANVINLPEFAESKMITQALVTRLRSTDPTSISFSLDDKKLDDLKTLHSLQKTLKTEQRSVALLADWLCLIRLLNAKALKIMKKHEK